MGTWGYKIFQNDDACDIKETYKENLIVGCSDDEAENAVVAEFRIDTGSDLWIPLAITQWNLGRLSNCVKNHALSAIERELEQLDKQWKMELIPKRREELLRVQRQLCSDMPKKRRLKMPWWAYRCPWEVGNVLQYKVQYPRENNPIADCYVMLLVCGISETPPRKIPCESFTVRLYNWYSQQAPITILEKILAFPPELTDFLTRSGRNLPAQTILPSDEMIQKGEMQRITKRPFLQREFDIIKPLSPMNSTFDELISRTLIQLSC